jgi:hypothetical protein
MRGIRFSWPVGRCSIVALRRSSVSQAARHITGRQPRDQVIDQVARRDQVRGRVVRDLQTERTFDGDHELDKVQSHGTRALKLVRRVGRTGDFVGGERI